VFSIDGDIPVMEEAAHKALRARAPDRVWGAGALEYRSVGVFQLNAFFELQPLRD
jgi:hypothetical protein